MIEKFFATFTKIASHFASSVAASLGMIDDLPGAEVEKIINGFFKLPPTVVTKLMEILK